MKFNHTIFVGLLIACLAISYAQSLDNNNNNVASEAEKIATATRSGLSVPKIFDFDRFKNTFNKKYTSFVEELARKKIFLGNAFRAFLSFFGYKHYKNDSYLKITEMADWTNEEFKAILNKRPVKGFKVVDVIDNDDNKFKLLEETPVADMKDIEEKLAELAAKHPELAAELNEPIKRKRRDLSSSSSLAAENESQRSSLKLDDLLGGKLNDNNNQQQLSLPVEQIPSNNPDYETPELSSYGAEDDVDEPMPIETSSFINNLPGASFVSSIYSSLFGGADDVTNERGSFFFDKHPPERKILPDEVFIDHRDSGCFGPAKNQRHCGSCYAFSTTGLYEWQFCHESGKRVEFSEQYVMDCGDRVGLKACGGGMEYGVGNFFGKFGLELSSKYPYRQRSEICPYDKSTPSKRMGYVRLLTDEDGGFMGVKHEYLQKYLNKFPMVMGLGVTPTFSLYGGGVDSGYTCDHENAHSMVLVGSGREDGKEYWLFRNSYGPTWGVDGHYKLNKNAKKCLLDDGMGYFIYPKKGESTVFDLKNNIYNDPKYVKQRYYDVMMGKNIAKNPINYVHDEPVENRDHFVTPPPSLY